jgi:hypothetical protein
MLQVDDTVVVKGVLVVRRSVRIASCILVLLLVLAFVPAVALAAPKADVTVPQWVTDAVNQVKAIAASAAAQLKPIAAGLAANLKQIAANAAAQIKANPKNILTILKNAASASKAAVDGARAQAKPIIEGAKAQIVAVIQAAMANLGTLTAQLKVKVLEMLNALKALIPQMPF